MNNFLETPTLEKLIAQGNYGKDINYKKVFDDQDKLDRLEAYLNWKLNDDLDWWKEWGVNGRVDVKVDNMIKDNDFQIIEYTGTDGSTIYEMFSDCDRYRFCCAVKFNPEVNEFCFNESL